MSAGWQLKRLTGGELTLHLSGELAHLERIVVNNRELHGGLHEIRLANEGLTMALVELAPLLAVARLDDDAEELLATAIRLTAALQSAHFRALTAAAAIATATSDRARAVAPIFGVEAPGE